MDAWNSTTRVGEGKTIPAFGPTVASGRPLGGVMRGPETLPSSSARGPGRELTVAPKSSEEEAGVGEGKEAGVLACGAGEWTGLSGIAGIWAGEG